MEDIAVSILLYMAFAVFVMCNMPRSHSTKTTEQRPVKQQETPVIDISCIFEEEIEVKRVKTPKVYKGYDSLTVKELREVAKGVNIRQAYKLSKAQLLEAIYGVGNAA